MRLIDADECLDFLKNNCSEDMYLAVRAILDPCKTVEERKQGGWIERFDEDSKWLMCTECHGDSDNAYNFCPNCGADMRGRKDN